MGASLFKDRVVLALAPLFIATWVSAATGQGLVNPYDIKTKSYPFRAFYIGHPLAEEVFQELCGAEVGSTTSQRECPFEDKDAFYEAMYSVESIRYYFQQEQGPCAYVASICENSEIWYNFYREVSVDITRLIEASQEIISSFGYGGCSFLSVSVGNPALVNPTTVSISGSYSGKKRICDNIFGKHDIGSATGKFVVSLNLQSSDVPRPIILNSETPETIVGDVVINNSERIYDQDHDFLVIFDLDTLGGRFLAGLLSLPFEPILALVGEDTAHESISNLMRTVATIDVSKTFDTAGKIFEGITRLPEEVPEVFPDAGVVVPYTLDSSRARIEKHGDQYFLVSSYVKVIPQFLQFQEAVRDANHNAVKFYNSLDSIGRTHVVASGEGLEEIVENEYGDLTFTYYISGINGVSNPNRLGVDQQLRLPSVWEIALDISQRNLIGPGGNHFQALVDFGLLPEEAMSALSSQQLPDYILPYQASVAVSQ